MGDSISRDKVGIGFPLRHGRRSTVLPVLIFLFCLSAATALGNRPSMPWGIKTPADTFSAKRAYRAYLQVFGDGSPHPTGSAAQKQMGSRLIAEFKQMGYKPQIQEAWVCSRWNHTFARVRNIAARLEGTQNVGAVLITAHYDSIPCGPGTMDDGSGTAAILELARAFQHGPKTLRPVIFLLSDGEEIGLLGAKAFLEHHPWASSVQTVVNIDAGGDGGPGLLSQIVGDGSVFVGTLNHIPHPVGSSAMGSFMEGFRLIEGTSDFEEYKKAGRDGINLISTGWYFNHHSSWDSSQRMNLRTLQDQGGHALTIARQLADRRRESGRFVRYTYFDLFGAVVISYSPAWAWALLTFSLALAVITIFSGSRLTKRKRRQSLLHGLGGWLLIMVAGIIASLLAFLFANGFAWPPMVNSVHPVMVLGLILLLAASAALGAYCFSASRLGKGDLPQGIWMILNLSALITGIFLPGADYLFSLPALTIGLTVILKPRKDLDNSSLRLLPGLLVAAVLWLPLFQQWATFLPPNLLSALIFLLLSAFIFPWLKPEFNRENGVILVLWVLVFLGPWAVLNGLPQERPRSYGNIVYLTDADQGRSFWLLPGRRPTPVWQAAGEAKWLELKNPILGIDRRYPAVAAADTGLESPVAVFMSSRNLPGGRVRMQIRLRSRRNARALWLAVSPRPLKLKANGLPMLSLKHGASFIKHKNDPWERCLFVGIPAEGLILELTMTNHDPIRLMMIDQTEGLPHAGTRLIKARSRYDIPYQNGDLTLVSKTFSF